MKSIDKKYFSIFEKVITQSDHFVKKHFSDFNPIFWEAENMKMLKRKAFTELAIYLSVADKRHKGEAYQLEAVSNNMLEICNSTAYLNLILKKKKNFLLFAAPILYANHIHSLAERTKITVEKVLGTKDVWALERVPNRILDLWNFCIAYNGYSSIDAQAAIDLSCVSYKLDLINSNLTDAYAFTHTPLFYYNFGVPNDAFPSEKIKHDIQFEIEGLILRYIAENNCDITLELLLIGILHDQISVEIIDYVINWVYPKLLRYGIIPGPGCENTEEGVDPSNWTKHYHTTFVAGATFRMLKEHYLHAISKKERVNMDKLKNLKTYFAVLGEIYVHFSNQEIPIAVEKSRLLYHSHYNNIPQKYKCYFDYLVYYVRGLQDVEGNFGFWTDEQQVFLKSGKTLQDFEQEFTKPINKLCHNFLSSFAQKTKIKELIS